MKITFTLRLPTIAKVEEEFCYEHALKDLQHAINYSGRWESVVKLTYKKDNCFWCKRERAANK